MKNLSWLLVACSLPLWAVDGIVLNGTTRRPQPGVEINLVQPSAAGMNQLGTAKSDSDGKFRIDKPIPPGPDLLQATYQGVTYNQIITPGMPTSGMEVKVFDATKSAEVGKAAEHLILIEATASEIQVGETFIFVNESTTTFSDPARGSAQFFIPPASVDKARIMINAPGGMPISRPPIKTGTANMYKVDYPLKPGQTRIDIAYSTPAAQKLSGKIAASSSGTHIVTPSTVTLTGDGIELAGREPQTQANIYNVTGLDYNVLIEGTGSLRSASPASPRSRQENAEGPGEDTGAPKIEVKLSRLDERRWWVIGLTSVILALGGAMLFRRGAA